MDSVGGVAARMIGEFFAEEHNRLKVEALLAELQVMPAAMVAQRELVCD